MPPVRPRFVSAEGRLISHFTPARGVISGWVVYLYAFLSSARKFKNKEKKKKENLVDLWLCAYNTFYTPKNWYLPDKMWTAVQRHVYISSMKTCWDFGAIVRPYTIVYNFVTLINYMVFCSDKRNSPFLFFFLNGRKLEKEGLFLLWDWIYFWLICWFGGMLQPVWGEEGPEICRTRLSVLPLAPVRHTYWGESPAPPMGSFLIWKARVMYLPHMVDVSVQHKLGNKNLKIWL